ncbi:hypothetical protein CALVIDRAFT_346360 [Calocera viscosa TUFC12733]|uniref:Uncharacterized protein n=1 Tax=Calocera viscosa (strain TUFC12733) TaxID=1330018 RepID=A0A167HBA4_CALVF|nr:hypothetical protein CALVIDRAFT_346360 [Calocera viscosa TUFC12733]
MRSKANRFLLYRTCCRVPRSCPWVFWAGCPGTSRRATQPANTCPASVVRPTAARHQQPLRYCVHSKGRATWMISTGRFWAWIESGDVTRLTRYALLLETRWTHMTLRFCRVMGLGLRAELLTRRASSVVQICQTCRALSVYQHEPEMERSAIIQREEQYIQLHIEGMNKAL